MLPPGLRRAVHSRSVALKPQLHPRRNMVASKAAAASSTSTTNGHTSARRSPSERVLTLKTINTCVLKAEYAVRGEIAIRAEELRVQCTSEEGRKKLGFDKVISCNIGNPQQLEQKPITFFRQVASLCEYPDLLNHDLVSQIYPKDAIARAKKLLGAIGSIGAYSHSKGVPAIRQNIASFLERRDGHPADPESIYLTTGASGGVSNMLQVMIANPSCGVLIPIPQYPLYTAALALNEAVAVPYYLRENEKWSLDIPEMRQAIHKARSDGTDLRAVVIINPGNPTGQCLSLENMKEIVELAYDEKLALLADEVYQTNVFDKKRPFVSFKKVLKDLGEPYASNLELVSFHSMSKGQIGECGRRGGFYEMVNFDKQAAEQIYKLASIQLCSGLQGQIGIDLMIDPPKQGDESYEKYQEEVDTIQSSLRERSTKICEAFEKMEGVTCNPAEGAMYLFPQIRLPEKAIEAAKAAKKGPDGFYCLQLLEKTGICVVPGTGFGQVPGTLHFRTTFLAPQTDEFVKRIKDFHENFMTQYS
ncbi:MAG: hypothetical protein CYPHOPRED_004531 [Cyphobasidiales sp. Tagirdzhanova-0007]|nr:MAG: hypothetical protein CYPHOPRED_004531 [Cyphobasidiales sp. Tagirdzhanova-0007]